MSVYGIWSGGVHNYAEPDLTADIERFETIQAAHDALLARYEDGHGLHTFNFVNRPAEHVRTPVVGNDTAMQVYLSLDIDDAGKVVVHDNGPDLRLVIYRGATVVAATL